MGFKWTKFDTVFIVGMLVTGIIVLTVMIVGGY